MKQPDGSFVARSLEKATHQIVSGMEHSLILHTPLCQLIEIKGMNMLLRPPKWPGSYKTETLSPGGDELRLSFKRNYCVLWGPIIIITKQTKSYVQKETSCVAIHNHTCQIHFVLEDFLHVFHQIRKKGEDE